MELADAGGPPTLDEMAAWSDWLGRPGCFVKNWRLNFLDCRRKRAARRSDDDAPSGEYPPMTDAAARGAYKGMGENPNAVRVIRQGDVPRDPDEPPLRGSNPNAKTPGGAS